VEVESAVRRHLLGDAGVNGYADGRVYRHRLQEKVDGTGLMAFVVLRNNGWATPYPTGEQEYPIVRVECWADPSRDEEGQVTQADAPDRAWAGARAVVRAMRWPIRGRMMGAVGSNPGLLVISVARRSEGFLVTEGDRHSSGGRSIVDAMGDSVKVVVEFNMSTVH
jgi:hypothetical protein